MTNSTSIGKNRLSLEAALSSVPNRFRKHILKHYAKIRQEFLRGAYDSSGINVGKFCEAVLRFLQQELTQQCIPFGQRISNFRDECQKLEQEPRSSGLESIRLIIPRALLFLYTVRSKRGIGHIGGDVDENKIDSVTTVRVADWIICELIRIKHGLSLEEAQDIVDNISIKTIPDVWEIAGRRIVLKKGLSYKQKTLLLAYTSQSEAILVQDLFDWTQHSNLTVFKLNVLKALDKELLILYDDREELVFLSPIGAKEVEETLLSS